MVDPKATINGMSSLRATRRILALTLALSVALWAASATGMLSAASHRSQCHARMPHMQHVAAPMQCCPSHAASLPVNYFTPPPCCDLSNQPARPLAFVVMPGKFRAGPMSGAVTASAMFVSPLRRSARLKDGSSPPFVKPVFHLKTDLRI
jgi:hypothetical protein